jgi:N-acyl-D-amino-acid deacylase
MTVPSRRKLIAAAWLIAASAGPLGAEVVQQPTTLIRGAFIVDGSGSPARGGDVRIEGDRIVEVGDLAPGAADVVVEAGGLMLAPGFIDSHSHHDEGLADHREALAMVSQGITTIVVGQDGEGNDLARRFTELESEPVAINVAAYAGHNSLRSAVLGDDFRRAATPPEIERMTTLLRAEMSAGALGLSTGLEYDPGIYSTPAEVLALAQVAADMGGRYISHVRSEDRDLWQAIEEVVAIGRATRMPVQVTHMKLGMSDLWGQADRLIRTLDAARSAGVRITADAYPYTYWQANLGVFYPKRNFAERAETEFILSHLAPADEILFSDGLPGHPEYARKTLAEIAALRGTSDVQAMLDLLSAPGGVEASIVARGMLDADVERILLWPFTSVCSDGSSTGVHPRGFGSFPRILGTYVRERKLLPLEEAVRKMTGLPADSLGIANRGLIAPGHYADLVLFDRATVADRSTFDEPQAPAAGIRTVWVNGQVVFDGGATTGRYPGRPLRRQE